MFNTSRRGHIIDRDIFAPSGVPSFHASTSHSAVTVFSFTFILSLTIHIFYGTIRILAHHVTCRTCLTSVVLQEITPFGTTAQFQATEKTTIHQEEVPFFLRKIFMIKSLTQIHPVFTILNQEPSQRMKLEQKTISICFLAGVAKANSKYAKYRVFHVSCPDYKSIYLSLLSS